MVKNKDRKEKKDQEKKAHNDHNNGACEEVLIESELFAYLYHST